MSTNYEFSFPTRILVTEDSCKILIECIKNEGFKRPLFVTDSNLEKLPLYADLLKQCQNEFSCGSFANITGNPLVSQVEDGIKSYKSHKADCLVMIGGGSAIDVGKAIAVGINNDAPLLDYAEGNPKQLGIDKELPYKIAIPTTAGTGSEVGRSSVVSADSDKKKYIIFSPKMLPETVIVDPNLTKGMPKDITAATGMDALTHCIEAYLAKGYHPMCDGIALEGLRLVANNLKKACDDPTDIKARQNMLLAALMGAVAFQKGLGVTHSCAHALSTHFDMHHGLANTLMLPAGLKFNQPEIKSKLEIMSQTVATKSNFITWVEKFIKTLGFNIGLSHHGVEINDALINTAFQDPCHPLNPRPVTKSDFLEIFKNSI